MGRGATAWRRVYRSGSPMRARIVGWLSIVLVGGGCTVGPEPARIEAPKKMDSEDPAIGQRFAVELPRGERSVRLEGVRGRVTLVCILGEAHEQVADACATVRERWGDRVEMVGIWVGSEPGDLTGLPFRAYVDLGGEALRQAFGAGTESEVLVLDVRGRLVERVGVDELDHLIDEVSRRLP